MFDHPLDSPAAVLEASASVLEHGVRYVLCTLGAQGALLAYRSGTQTFAFQMPAILPRRVVDPTGCGDTFGAAFLKGILEGETPPKALALAAAAASLNCEEIGLEGARQIPRARARLRESHPALLEKLEAGWPGEPL